MKKSSYRGELKKLQIELVRWQEWIKQTGLKVVVVFEGRDAAGKGGAIKRITQHLNPRTCRVVALGKPPIGRRPNGISSATLHTCQRRERSFYSIVVGTIEQASSVL